jgi:predicted nucleic acid-binding protein
LALEIVGRAASEVEIELSLHLDTNIFIASAEPNHLLRAQLLRWRSEGRTLSTSAMAWAEFRCGPASPSLIAAWEFWIAGRIVPIDESLAELGADLFNATGRRTRSLADCLVAACAIQQNAALATLNIADFNPMVSFGLRLIDIDS